MDAEVVDRQSLHGVDDKFVVSREGRLMQFRSFLRDRGFEEVLGLDDLGGERCCCPANDVALEVFTSHVERFHPGFDSRRLNGLWGEYRVATEPERQKAAVRLARWRSIQG